MRASRTGVEVSEPFQIFTESHLVLFTPWQADSIRSLLECLRQVSGSSIFYHFVHALRRRHFTTYGYRNDFANWVTMRFQERELAERLAVIDPLEFPSVRAVRDALIHELEVTTAADEARWKVPPGDEFRFVTVKSFVYPTGLVASTPRELVAAIERASLGSFFFHFVEARLRSGGQANDYSRWLEQQSQERAVLDRIARLSPYLFPLAELRSRVTTLIREGYGG